MCDLFGGALCLRQAWAMLTRAVEHRWGVKTPTTWGFNVPPPKLTNLLFCGLKGAYMGHIKINKYDMS